MATPVLDNLDFGKLAQLLNALLHGVTADPSTPGVGQIWFRTDTKQVKVYDGTAIQTFQFAGQTLDAISPPVADVSFNQHKATNLADATQPQDAVNLRTLLNNVSGLSASQEVVYASAAALPANTYANGASGVGATLTATANAALVIDGQTPLVNQRVLVQNEATSANNGIYTVTQVGTGGLPYILTRAIDFNQSTNIGPGIIIPVEVPAAQTAGTLNGKVFLTVTKTSPVVGTDPITMTQIGSTYSAGAGLSLAGTSFSLTAPVTVALGGTNATTAAGARTNLGVPGKYAVNVGDGSTLAYTVNHALGTTDVVAQVWETGGSKRLAIVDTAVVDANNITVTFNAAPASNAYRVVVTG